jgi:hypothetical protein
MVSHFVVFGIIKRGPIKIDKIWKYQCCLKVNLFTINKK